MKTVYIALGSNLGDRVANLLLAREQVVSPHVRLTRASSIYETAPREIVDQPWFLNQVVKAETTLFPRQLLARLLRIEQEMGRLRTIAKGPRLIDLDILLFGDAIVHAAGLEIPHPRMAERRFVLEPLAELAPALRPPRSSLTVRELLAKVMDQPVRRL
ncbi:MAG: 2-amino-4-hydroxy-6-hydroxymethyldihydropteridine diphosphokinase [Acidobacteriota bacterium]